MNIGQTMSEDPARFLPLEATLAPADPGEAAEAVRAAFAEKKAVYPLGGGTQICRGAWPQRPGLGLRLAKLSKVVDYPADDMTITVEAGLTAKRLAATLAEHHQQLPIDVPMAAQATIGGLIALGHSGPRRLAYGTLRDYVLGLEAIDGRGTRFRAGGRVVKNAAGLNVHRMMVGALGTLGVITEVTLIVRPQPECSALLACDVPDWQQAERLLAAILRSDTLPTAVELLAGTYLEQAPPVKAAADTVARLLVGFEGTEAEVCWMLEQLAAEWRKEGIAEAKSFGPAEAVATWEWLCALPADIEMAVLPGRTTAAVYRLLQIVPLAGVQAHAGNGVICVALPPQGQARPDSAPGGSESWSSPGENRQGHSHTGVAEADASEGHGKPHQMAHIAALVRNKLRPAIAELGGRVRILRTPPGVALTREDVWGPLGKERAVMDEIKQRFDPAGILNPGRFIFP